MPITFNRIDTLLRDLETSINCFDALRAGASTASFYRRHPTLTRKDKAQHDYGER